MACGIILIIISVLGLIGAVKHHQVVLFFVSFKLIVCGFLHLLSVLRTSLMLQVHGDFVLAVPHTIFSCMCLLGRKHRTTGTTC